MTKTEFMNQLNINLYGINEEDKKDILNDFEEHFRVGLEDGKSEDEISKELGEPSEIAKQYKGENNTNKKPVVKNEGSIFGAIVIGICLFFFNICLVSIPFFTAIGLLFGLYGCAIGFVFGGAGMTIAFIIPFFRGYMNIPFNPAVGIFASIGLCALGVLLVIASIYVTKYFIKVLIKYFKWNINVIRRQGGNGDV